MKKDQPRQDRRRRALDRFKISPAQPDADPKLYAAYLARKHTELAALKSALGVL